MAETNYSAVDFSQLSATDDGKTILYKDGQLCQSTSSISEIVNDKIGSKGYATETFVTGSIEDLSGTVSADYATKEELGNVGNFIITSANQETGEPIIEPSAAQTKSIYLIQDDSVTGIDQYKEWIVTENESEEKEWTCIGDTTVNLSDYAKTTDVEDALALKQDSIARVGGSGPLFGNNMKYRFAPEGGTNLNLQEYNSDISDWEDIGLIVTKLDKGPNKILKTNNINVLEWITPDYYTKSETSGKQEIQDALALKEDKVFVAEYNVTPYADIKAAYDAGKQIFLLAKNFNEDTPAGWSPYTFKVPLTDFYSLGNDTWFRFSFFNDGSPAKRITVNIKNNNVWSVYYNTLQDTLTAGTDLVINNGVIGVNTNGTATGNYAFAEGAITSAFGDYSHAEGGATIAAGNYSHAEGGNTRASGNYSHAEGENTRATAYYSHAEGTVTRAAGKASHAEGGWTSAVGIASHAEGSATRAAGDYSHAGGVSSIAEGSASFAHGYSVSAVGNYTFAEGSNTYASGDYSHTEGFKTNANNLASHAEGAGTSAVGVCSHAEGDITSAVGENSHAEGLHTSAVGENSHAEGESTIASGLRSHAEGYFTCAVGDASHAEGNGTSSCGMASHAEGGGTIASGRSSHAEGYWTIAGDDAMHVGGKYNFTSANAAFVIGNGSEYTRSDAFIVDWNGVASAQTDIKANGVSLTGLSNTVANFGSYEIVASTGSIQSPTTKTIYLIKDTSVTGSDQYSEWICTNTATPSFEKIGDTSIDLTPYLTKTSADTLYQPAGNYATPYSGVSGIFVDNTTHEIGMSAQTLDIKGEDGIVIRTSAGTTADGLYIAIQDYNNLTGKIQELETLLTTYSGLWVLTNQPSNNG